jgi:MFS superfamily sulfate permease-like transporter
MGAMNLLAVPLGALPMCHGSGGVAGKHAFGARTAGANLVLGALYVGAAFVGAELIAAFPLAALGVVLVLVAGQLARTSLDTDSLGLTVGVGVLGLATNVGLAFVVGIGASVVLARVRDVALRQD